MIKAEFTSDLQRNHHQLHKRAVMKDQKLCETIFQFLN